MSARRIRRKDFEPRYRAIGADKGICWYCQGVATGVDHVPPVSISATKSAEQWREEGVRHVLVPACFQCNKWLSAIALFRLSERTAFLAAWSVQWCDWYAARIARLAPARRFYRLQQLEQAQQARDRLAERWTSIASELERRGEDPHVFLAKLAPRISARSGHTRHQRYLPSGMNMLT